MEAITLKVGDTVRAAAWAETVSVIVGTIEEFYTRTYPGQPAKVEEGIERAIAYGHDFAWTLLPPSGLYSDRAYAAKKLAEAQERAERAVILKAGDRVEINGRAYTVSFAEREETREYPMYANPIKFVPVQES